MRFEDIFASERRLTTLAVMVRISFSAGLVVGLVVDEVVAVVFVVDFVVVVED